jgi:hypothetical protein
MEKLIKVNGLNITARDDGSVGKMRYGEWIITFGSSNGNGYRRIDIGGRLFYVHQIIAMAFLDDYSEGLRVDHIDGNGNNNRRENLRMLTQQKNTMAHNRKRGGTSEYRGVHLRKDTGKWQAYCRIDGKKTNHGCFDTEREAALARDSYVHSLGYPTEGLNFPEHFRDLDE